MSDLDFKTLGISSTATASQIRKAFRKLALIHHPDKGIEKDATKFKEILGAYERLMEEKLRVSPGKSEEYQDLDRDFSDADEDTLEKVLYARVGKNKDERWAFWRDPDQDKKRALYERLWPTSLDPYGSNNLSGDNINEKTWNKVKKYFFEITWNVEQDGLSWFKRGAKFLKYCGRYVTDSFQPWLSLHDKKKDLFSPIMGIKNIGLALAEWAGLLLKTLMVIPYTVEYCFFEKRQWHEKQKSLRDCLSYVGFDYVYLTQLKEVIGHTISGIILVLMAPITIFVKIPLRSLISLFKEPKKMEESEKIQRYLTESEAALTRDDKNAVVIILKVLHHKFKKDMANSRQSDISPDMEKKMYRDVKKHTIAGTLHRCSTTPINEQQKLIVRNYLSLFRPKNKTASHEFEPGISNSSHITPYSLPLGLIRSP